MGYAIIIACILTAAFIGYRYGRHAERLDQRRSGVCLQRLARQQERTEAGLN